MRQNLLAAVFLLLLMFTASGCLVAASNNDTRTGNYVAENTISQIDPNTTTKSWVAGIVGEPSSKVKLDEQTEIWKYNYTERHESSGGIFLIFGGSNTKETTHTLFVEFHGDVVTRKWQG